MATTNNHNRTRSRWGMCLNDTCEKSKNHERIEIVGRKDFVCPECGKPLKECPPPTSTPWGKYVAIAAAVLVLGGGGAYFAFSGNEKSAKSLATDQTPETTEKPAVDSAAVAQAEEDTMPAATPATTDNAPTEQTEPAKPEEKVNTPKTVEKTKGNGTTKKTQPSQPVNRPYGTVRVAYGSYTGDLRNGKPHGHGTVKFSTTYTINSSIVAHAGDSYEGEFRDGRISGGPGYWSHDGDKKYVNP